MKEQISWFENLFYGYRRIGGYDSGINLEYILPEIHKRYYGVGFCRIEVRGDLDDKRS